MKTEDKELLLKDLCARLPYEVCVELSNHHLVKHIYSIKSISMENGWTTGVLECAGRKKIYSAKIEDVKPYLCPMSSMTEEEQKEYHKTFRAEPYGNGYVYVESVKSFDWLNAHHFDYRGLIDKGLAIEVTEDNDPYKD